MARLADKVALITGGTTGIGAATARLFKAEGATVIATGANPAGLARAQADLPGVEVVLSDQADPAASERLVADVVARHGRIDVLFVNAGVGAFAPLDQLTEESFDRQFGINVRGPLFLAKAATPHMPPDSSIVFTGSTAGSAGMAAASIYSATKAAVRSLGRTLGAELAPKGIRVNVVSPGPVETPIFGKTGLSPEEVAGFKAGVLATMPLQRMGRPEEIAAIVLFLAADATFVTGEEVVAGGGLVVI